MTDIVKRLRSNKVLLVGDMKAGNSIRSAMLDAADEIDRLRAILNGAPDAVANPSPEWCDTYAAWCGVSARVTSGDHGNG